MCLASLNWGILFYFILFLCYNQEIWQLAINCVYCKTCSKVRGTSVCHITSLDAFQHVAFYIILFSLQTKEVFLDDGMSISHITIAQILKIFLAFHFYTEEMAEQALIGHFQWAFQLSEDQPFKNPPCFSLQLHVNYSIAESQTYIACAICLYSTFLAFLITVS